MSDKSEKLVPKPFQLRQGPTQYGPVSHREELAKSIHGKHALRIEMQWAIQMALTGEPDDVIPTEHRAEYRAKIREQLQPVVEALCDAAFKGNDRVFFRLAECVAAMRKRGNTWENQRRARLVTHFHATGEPINVTEMAERILHVETKTVRKDARAIGIPLKAKSGRPKKSGK